uniref:Uncharacterized protein n=1 Tax=Graphocephala atropunctata TaxID=36148 RepID=A0A1B6ME50_9HEMI
MDRRMNQQPLPSCSRARPAGTQDLHQSGEWVPNRTSTPTRIPVYAALRQGQQPQAGCALPRPAGVQNLQQAGEWVPGRQLTPSRIPVRVSRRAGQRNEFVPTRREITVEESFAGRVRPVPEARQAMDMAGEWAQELPSQIPVITTSRTTIRQRRHYRPPRSVAEIPRMRGPPPDGDQMRTGTGWADQLPNLQCPRSEMSFPGLRRPPTGGDQMRTGTGWADQLPDLQCPRGTPRPTGLLRSADYRNEHQRSHGTAPQSGVLRCPAHRNEFRQSFDTAPPTGVLRCPTHRNEFGRSNDTTTPTGVLRCPTHRNEFGRSQSEISLPRMRGAPPGGDQMRTGAGWADQLPDIQTPRYVSPPRGVRRDPAYRNEFARSTQDQAGQSSLTPNTAAVMQEVHTIVNDARARINQVVQNISRQSNAGQGPYF